MMNTLNEKDLENINGGESYIPITFGHPTTPLPVSRPTHSVKYVCHKCGSDNTTVVKLLPNRFVAIHCYNCGHDWSMHAPNVR